MSTWHPIETAPQDVYVLIYSPTRGALEAIRTDRSWRVKVGGRVRPTHWMPLPDPLEVQPVYDKA